MSDSSDNRPDEAGGGEPLEELVGQDVEAALEKVDALVSEAAEQVGVGSEGDGAGVGQEEAGKEQGQAQDRREAGTAEQAGDATKQAAAEAGGGDQTLAELESLLAEAEQGQQGATEESQPSGPLSREQVAELDELIAGTVDQEALSELSGRGGAAERSDVGGSGGEAAGEAGGPGGEPAEGSPEAEEAGRSGPASEGPGKEASGSEAATTNVCQIGAVPGPVAVVVCWLAELVVQVVEAVDRPLRWVPGPVRQVAGWVAIATLAVAAVAFVISLLGLS